ncbi:MAG: SOS response-associated peptidase [Desulfovermiculus sp.]
MCGRFGLWADQQKIQDHFQIQEPLPFEPRYNIAPSQEILAIGQDENNIRKSAKLRWGLVPHWAKDTKTGYKMINARAETIWKKPAFRAAAKRRRCLIPASCFFEWKNKEKGSKQPYCIRPKHGDLFAFAALWEHWHDKETDEKIDSCTIVTTEANTAVSDLHDRMPVIIPLSGYNLWLDRTIEEPDELNHLIIPCPAEDLDIYPISKEVNNPKNDLESVVKPIDGD